MAVKARKQRKAGSRFVWTPDNVASRNMARTVVRTYIEQRMLSQIIAELDDGQHDHNEHFLFAAEVGAGFGRMTVALANSSLTVTAFEREPHLIATMRRLLPSVAAVQVNSLGNLPSPAEQFDLVLCFTVLQHMSDKDAVATLAEMARISSRYVLVVEDTDPEHHYVDPRDSTHFTHGRTAGWYAEHLPDFEIVNYWPREVEPGFTYKGVPRPTVGEYMLFERAS